MYIYGAWTSCNKTPDEYLLINRVVLVIFFHNIERSDAFSQKQLRQERPALN